MTVHPDSKVREVLFSMFPLSYSIKKVNIPTDVMDRRLFLDSIKTLLEIEDRKDFMLEEIGIDITAYEDMFFRVIENLFKIAFSTSQTALIQDYIYSLKPDKEWDGYVSIRLQGKEEQLIDIKTPEKLWQLLQKVK
jgi:hypothetical protein|tara:strand:- start:747 stop:1154 length:408 start_codon:yes stop_codon:yes gene_type:complete